MAIKKKSTDIALYKSKDGSVKLDVQFEKETVWLSLNQLADLFRRDKSVVSRHLRNVFKEKELDRRSVVAKNATTAALRSPAEFQPHSPLITIALS